MQMRLRALCHDIYAMRLAGELRLEEELFCTLIRIYRTPTVLFEFTKLSEVSEGRQPAEGAVE